jgi:hypothetical protein
VAGPVSSMIEKHTRKSSGSTEPRASASGF